MRILNCVRGRTWDRGSNHLRIAHVAGLQISTSVSTRFFQDWRSFCLGEGVYADHLQPIQSRFLSTQTVFQQRGAPNQVDYH